MKAPGESLYLKTVSRDKYGQNSSCKILFSGEIVNHGKILISIFENFFASIKEISIWKEDRELASVVLRFS